MNELMEQFIALATTVGWRTSRERVLYRCREVFSGVELAGRNVLDIGAGAGTLSAYAVACGARTVIAVDPVGGGNAAKFGNRLQAMREGMGPECFGLFLGRIQEYDPGELRFDVVVSYNSINHLDEPMCAILHKSEQAREAYRGILGRVAGMMKDEGLFVIADVSRHSMWAWLGIKSPLDPYVEWEKHQSPGTWLKLLESVGFSKVKLSWHLYHPLRFFGVLAANRAVNFFTNGSFRLVVRKTDRR